jgi:hypothetical protein
MATPPEPAGTYDAGSILDRVADVAGATNDTELARALGISPQVLSKWRSRGAVRFKQLHDFAVRTDASLDYMVLGVGSRKRRALDVDPGLFVQAWVALEVAFSKAPSRPVVAPFEKVFYTALLYNKVADMPEDAPRRDALRREVEHLVAIRDGMNAPDPLALAGQFSGESNRPSTAGASGLVATSSSKSRKPTTKKSRTRR